MCISVNFDIYRVVYLNTLKYFHWGGGTTPTRIFFDTILQAKGMISTKFAKDRNHFDRSGFRQVSKTGLISTLLFRMKRRL